ncbi:MAG: ATP-binding cassette domain-containing protein [Propionibacteriaceae bacterium]|jgi:ABC-2 type transport system ATP-binding protein|nr:ATP-binding cassette domain-containing protein [Propionibacteriaceae bacterium]
MTSDRGLEANHLTKVYGGQAVVSDLSFTVRPGEVMGFLGPNGAGKSTTMRLLTGITSPDGGEALLGGVPVRHVANPGLVVGAVLDAGHLHPGRTVLETMRLVTLTLGLPAAAGVDGLHLLGLGSALKLRVRALSLGMRQRLSLAMALVSDPRFLILDEPMNGLDTEGIAWVKATMRQFAQRGAGILVSTHLIGEIEALADRVVVIDRGRMVTEAKPEELGRLGTWASSRRDADLAQALRQAGLTVAAEAQGLLVAATPEAVGQIALAAGVPLIELREHRQGLAQFVLENTSGRYAAHQGGPASPWPSDTEPAAAEAVQEKVVR